MDVALRPGAAAWTDEVVLTGWREEGGGGGGGGIGINDSADRGKSGGTEIRQVSPNDQGKVINHETMGTDRQQ